MSEVHRAYQTAAAAGVITGGSFLLTLPTGAGKTHLAQQAAAHDLQEGPVLVLTPTKALAAQTASSYQTRLGPGVRVEVYTRDRRNARPYGDSDVIVTTPERLDLLTRHWRKHHHWLSRISLLTVDEAHLLADPERGAHLDAAITRFRLINPLARILALTATCGNPAEISAWLGARHIHSEDRPVPLHWTAVTAQNATRRQDALLNALDSRHTLIFVHSRRRAEDLARQLQAAGHAAAAHHAGLKAEARAETEAKLQRGELRVVVATPTLEVGVNFPVEHVILYDLSFTVSGSSRRTRLGTNAAWQRAGRAGRVPGMTRAQVTVIGHPDERPGDYEHAPMEALRSALHNERPMQLFLLGSIHAGTANTAAQCGRLAARTLAGHQGAGSVDRALAALLELRGAEQDSRGRLSLTPLGRIASTHLLSLQEVAAADHLPPDPTAYDVLLGLTTHLPTVRCAEDAALTIEATEQQVPSRTLDAAEMLSEEQRSAAHVLYQACLNGDAESAALHGLYEPQVTALRDSAARLCEAWAEYHPTERKLRLVGVMLRAGLPLEHASLTMLSGVGHATARRLAHAGVSDVEAVATSLSRDLEAAGLSPKRAQALIEQAGNLVDTFNEDVTREPPAREDRKPYPLDLRGRTDALRLNRALHLTVTPTGAGYTVSGGEQPHHVERRNGALHCDCLDHTRVHRCKHVLTTLLHEQDPDTTRNAEVLGD